MKSAPAGERGAIFTRREVVDFILDLIDYTPENHLWDKRLLEPSFGSGDFLFAAISRLLVSASLDSIEPPSLRNCLRAVELHRDTFRDTRTRTIELLRNSGVSLSEATALAETWLVNGDYLLESFNTPFDFVAGNPPYLRQESIPAALLAEYRQRYTTLYDRADLYVPFIERSLRLLGEAGTLGFICSDRWMKNRYGGPLREMVNRSYRLKYYVDMVGTPAFQTDVIAYPAITVIQRGVSGSVRVAHRPEISEGNLDRLARQLKSPSRKPNGAVTELPCAGRGSEPWLLEADARPSLALVRRLESDFPTLEEAGCAVGIGVATGADSVFIGPYAELDVEDERKLPLATTRDIIDGTVKWRGLGVVNPFEEDGSLADFARYPRFAAYLESHGPKLRARHCAQRANRSWYRTIDRITPSLSRREKLLIPDIKGAAHIVYEGGELYPHHNLYHIVSREWPLRPLQAVLMSGIAQLFVRAYSTKMHGGSLRFQAQYLRRIRLPHWRDVNPEVRTALVEAAENGGAEAILASVRRIYRLSSDDLPHLTSPER